MEIQKEEFCPKICSRSREELNIPLTTTDKVLALRELTFWRKDVQKTSNQDYCRVEGQGWAGCRRMLLWLVPGTPEDVIFKPRTKWWERRALQAKDWKQKQCREQVWHVQGIERTGIANVFWLFTNLICTNHITESQLIFIFKNYQWSWNELYCLHLSILSLLIFSTFLLIFKNFVC